VDFRHNAAWEDDIVEEQGEGRGEELFPNVVGLTSEQSAALLGESYSPLNIEEKLHKRQVHLTKGFFDQEQLRGAFTCFLERAPKPCAGCAANVNELKSLNEREQAHP
jgi:hypothetical protein